MDPSLINQEQKNNIMKKQFKNLCTILVLLALCACSKDDGVTTPETPMESSEKQITSFVFRADDNTALTMDISASINETDKRITATVPFGTDISALRPEIAISDKASVSNNSVNDFTEIVKITVTAEDGSTATYDIIVGIEPNNANTILSFTFSLTENPIAITIVGEIDEENQTITFETPLGTDISSLLPQIQTSTGAGFSPEGRQDFNELVVYTVTAENGAEKSYDVIWEISQRDILLTLYNENPENDLDWDLTDSNIANWEGVFIDEDGNVIQLNFTGENISNLPKVLGRLSELLLLNLNFNSITEIPTELGQLTKLETLLVGVNQLTAIPLEIGQLTQLKLLSFAQNELTSIPEVLGSLINLENLSLSSNQLTSLPTDIGELKQLKFLNISSNGLTVLPDQIGQLGNLENLSLFSNELTSIPSSIGQLKQLISLNLEFNKITAIPEELRLLESLINLDLSDNEITELPSSIGQLKALKFLEVKTNKLTALPEELGQLVNLENLSLGSNELTTIPHEIGNLNQLLRFTLINNQLTSLPEELGLLTNLEFLLLFGNPDLKSIPKAICDLEDSGTAVIKDISTICE